jgi:hypothetical protein
MVTFITFTVAANINMDGLVVIKIVSFSFRKKSLLPPPHPPPCVYSAVLQCLWIEIRAAFVLHWATSSMQRHAGTAARTRGVKKRSIHAWRLEMVKKFLNYFLFLYLKYENKNDKVGNENDVNLQNIEIFFSFFTLIVVLRALFLFFKKY